jgi:hypothetical protein
MLSGTVDGLVIRHEGVSVTPPSQDENGRFLKTAEQYGHWNTTPEENARIGIRSV